MRVPLSWLKEFVDIPLRAEVLAERLTMAGLEVESIQHVGDETVLTLGVTPNRPDWLGIIGVAREVAVLRGARLKKQLPVTGRQSPVTPTAVTGNRKLKAGAGVQRLAEFLRVRVTDRRACPRYTARVIDGVRIGPAPAQVQARLAAAGIRPVNNVVDATNYVMLEHGQPLHAFDWAKIRGQQLQVRRAASAGHFTTLDGVARALLADDLLICDAEGPVALAGIMGGANSEITSQTTRIVLESAYFAPTGVRRTSRRLGLSSESSRRFERGVDPHQVDAALHRVTALICAWAGGTPTRDWVDCYPAKIRPKTLTITPGFVAAVLGTPCPAPQMATILTRLGCRVRQARRWSVQVPTFRPDLAEPIDLCEEIGRCWGYDRIPATLPRGPMGGVDRPAGAAMEERLRQWCIANGFTESVHYSFITREMAAVFDTHKSLVEIRNPLGQEPAVLVGTLAAGLVEAVQLNTRSGQPSGRLFQMGRVFQADGPTGVREGARLAGVLFGARKSMSWTFTEDVIDFYDVKGSVTALLQSLHLAEAGALPDAGTAFLHPGQSCQCRVGGQVVGVYGMLHPDLMQRVGLEVPVGFFELDLDCLQALHQGQQGRYAGIPRFPGVRRDLALLVDQQLPAATVAEAIQQGRPALLKALVLFDLYQGGRLPAGKKSLAYALFYQDPSRTLTDEEVGAAHKQIVERVTQLVGAEVR